MKKNNFISILISNYNKEKYLNKCLLSTIKQNYKNYEILIYDDKSTDNSNSIIEKFKKIRLIKNKRKKKMNSSPLNQLRAIIEAFKGSKGKIICLLDSDDLFKPNKLKKINSYFNLNPKKLFVANFPETKKTFLLKRIRTSRSTWPTVFPTSCISFKRKFFIEFLKNCKKNEFPNLEIDARLIIFAHHFYDDLNIVRDKLTKYTYDRRGISSLYKKYSLSWWLKRSEAFEYLRFILNKRKTKFITSLDFYITIMTSFFAKIIKGIKCY